MNILYVFPHPDDESFGPAAVIHQQVKAGHQVYLLTLTRGGATQQRYKLGLSIEEMGEVRHKEMLAVEKALQLSGMTVLDFPDSGLKEMDPRDLEQAIKEHIKSVEPDIIVTYPVHGISGFHDHLVTHAVVKRVYHEMRQEGAEYLKRLAFITLPDSGAPTWTDKGLPRFKLTEESLIDCVIALGEDDLNAMREALKCYATYKDTIDKSGIMETIGTKAYFEIYWEDFTPPLSSLTEGMAD
ncbi:PIG-L deacetylase family protein [Fibrobacterota bacterium]